ncbi:unnamed protein product [Paramecium octaurelia]|uniref:Uncharacterized protein n=1 Tax=Paramecium octaurelia TaxID=43137 RepID=A0A8S1SY28_PAROT|nr:unnamed protein product [Paramecium octaurelia]
MRYNLCFKLLTQTYISLQKFIQIFHPNITTFLQKIHLNKAIFPPIIVRKSARSPQNPLLNHYFLRFNNIFDVPKIKPINQFYIHKKKDLKH